MLVNIVEHKGGKTGRQKRLKSTIESLKLTSKYQKTSSGYKQGKEKHHHVHFV